MQIRHATLADVPAVLAAGREYFVQMEFDKDGNGYDPQHVTEWLRNVTTRPDDFISLLMEEAGQVIGLFMVALAHRHPWHVGPKKACELAWHAHPALPAMYRGKIMIKLMQAMEAEIKQRRIRWFYVGCSAKEDFQAVHEYLDRRGHRDVGFLTAKEYSYE